MTIYHGDIKEDEPLAWDFNTNSAASAPITLAGSASLAVYKDGGTTQSTAGLTLTVDLDSVTGLHHVAVVTTNAFYVTGSDYSVVLAAGTVDSISVVGVVVGSFSIENRSVAAVKTDTAAILVDSNELQSDWANGGRLDVLLDAIPTDAMRGTDSASLASVCTEARLAELDAANLPTDVAAIPTTAMRGTDSASTATALATAQSDLTQIKGDLPTKITKNIALANFMFLMITASDDITPLTGATVTATRSIDGASFASCANSVSEVSNGWYKISLAASDLNGDVIALRFTATLANDTNISIVTQA